MRLRLISILALAAAVNVPVPAAEAPQAAPTKGERDLLVFKNGDSLHGRLEAIEPGEGVQWNRSDAIAAFEFKPDMIAEVQFGSSTSPEGWTNTCAIHLADGSELRGKLLSYDGRNVMLDTWYAGQVSLPGKAVAMLLPLNASRAVTYQGPTGLEGWTMGELNAAQLLDAGVWHYSKGAFYAAKPASIARDVDLPGISSLQFDLQWRGFFHIAIALYTSYLHPISLQTKETEPEFGGFYSMQINPFSANLLPVKQTEPLRYLGQAPLRNLSQRNSAHFDIRMNRHKRTIALLVDGELIKEWTDPNAFAGSGTAIRFVHQGQGVVRLSNIKVSEWDGVFEETPSLTPNKSHDLARLRNGDRILGPIEGIDGGQLRIQAAGTVLDIPLERVKQVELAAAEPKAPRAGPGMVRAHFASTGALTFELEKWTPEGVVARSESFGTLTFKPEAFSKIEFSLEPAAESTK